MQTYLELPSDVTTGREICGFYEARLLSGIVRAFVVIRFNLNVFSRIVMRLHFKLSRRRRFEVPRIYLDVGDLKCHESS